MAESNTLARSMHDLGLGAWFGGSLMGAIALNGTAREWGDRTAGARIASIGWAKWTPVNGVAIAAHLAGAAALLSANLYRVRNQQGVGASSVAKTVVTGAAMAATAYSRVLGKKIELSSSPEPQEKARAEQHPVPTERARRQLRFVQWSVPALTGVLTAITSLQGEQQRPGEQRRGMMRKAVSRLDLT